MKDQLIKISDAEILNHVIEILDSLGPFEDSTKRSAKWRTAEQLAAAISDKTPIIVNADRIEKILHRCHNSDIKALNENKPLSSPIRRAMRPDLNTTKALWGSTKHLGFVWKEFPKDTRYDIPGAVLKAQKIQEDSKIVFLSHCNSDKHLAFDLANELNSMGINVWMAETQIEYGGDIIEEVRNALHESDAILGLLTKSFISSLWCRTELHTAMSSNYPTYLIIDSSDLALLDMLSEMKFKKINNEIAGIFERSKLSTISKQLYDQKVISDLEKYIDRARDFASNLPTYLGKNKTAYYLNSPKSWNGPFKLDHLDKMIVSLQQNV